MGHTQYWNLLLISIYKCFTSADYTRELKVIVDLTNNTIRMYINSMSCEQPMYYGIVYEQRHGRRGPVRFISSELNGYVLTGFTFWTSFTFKAFLRCPSYANLVYSHQRVYVGGVGRCDTTCVLDTLHFITFRRNIPSSSYVIMKTEMIVCVTSALGFLCCVVVFWRAFPDWEFCS